MQDSEWNIRKAARPLFKFTKNEKPGRVEVFRKNCPELFAVIDDSDDLPF